MFEIETVWGMSFDRFLRMFSKKSPEHKHYQGNVWAVSNEADYIPVSQRIQTRGGIHLAISGGLDAALTQSAVMQPDLSIFVDINLYQIRCLKLRGKLLKRCRDGAQFWAEYPEELSRAEMIIRDNSIYVSNGKPNQLISDFVNGGWSSDEYYDRMREFWGSGKIKSVEADLTGRGLDTATIIASLLGMPVNLIYLSNIHDYFDYRMGGEMIDQLRVMRQTGLVPGEAQIIYWSGQHAQSKILGIDDFLKSV